MGLQLGLSLLEGEAGRVCLGTKCGGRYLFPYKREVQREVAKINSEDLYNLHSSPYITGVTKSRRVKWAEHVAPIREMKN
jgi:hypothetical protein